MSQASAAPVSSLQSQDQDQLRTHGCRWAWCRLTFPTNTELVYHVIHDHVHRTVPVMRKDVPILKRAEEGIGESLSMSGIGMSYKSFEGESNSGRGEKNISEIELYSSPLSPPASSPTSRSPVPPLKLATAGFSPAAASLDGGQPSGSPIPPHTFDQIPTPPSAHLPTILGPSWSRFSTSAGPGPPLMPESRLGDDLQHGEVMPTFASLSSPTGSLSVSASPSTAASPVPSSVLDLGFRKDKTISSKTAALYGSQFQKSYGSQSSQSSSGSSALVEQQLTQSMGVDDDGDSDTGIFGAAHLQADEIENYTLASDLPADLDTYTAGIHWRESTADQPQVGENISSSPPPHLQSQISQTHSETPHRSPTLHQPQWSSQSILSSNGTAPSPAPAQGPVRIQRQAWYGTLPQSNSRQNSGPSSIDQAATISVNEIAHPSAQPFALSNPARKVNIHTDGERRSSGNTLRSGILKTTPLVQGPAPMVEEERVIPEQTDPHSQLGWSQSQSQTEGSPYGYLSYSALQTQAPYQSQSLSQM